MIGEHEEYTPATPQQRENAAYRADLICELREVERRAGLFAERLKVSGGIVGEERRKRVEDRVEVWDARAGELVDILWPVPSGKAEVNRG